ncbi:MAG: PHP domain-containing protein [Firmicutes bacterium]|jgi:predicted metal-dependent phosphoesterase TrpH|nr:PHP domain-containing protein [Bacillota bacterium]
MLRRLVGDLHVHTFLSPCAAREMSPRAVVARCVALGLDIIAITDHNSGLNVEQTVFEARGTELAVIGGIEVQTREEVHVITLLPDLESLAKWDASVRRALPPGQNTPEIFGEQWVVNPRAGSTRQETAFLAARTTLSIDEVVSRVGRLGGLCIPAHVDRPSFSMLGQLGFIPPHLDLPALEVSRNVNEDQARRTLPAAAGRRLVCSSDAHTLSDIGTGCSVFTVERPTLPEIIMAVRGEGGRNVEIE